MPVFFVSHIKKANKTQFSKTSFFPLVIVVNLFLNVKRYWHSFHFLSYKKKENFLTTSAFFFGIQGDTSAIDYLKYPFPLTQTTLLACSNIGDRAYVKFDIKHKQIPMAHCMDNQ